MFLGVSGSLGVVVVCGVYLCSLCIRVPDWRPRLASQIGVPFGGGGGVPNCGVRIRVPNELFIKVLFPGYPGWGAVFGGWGGCIWGGGYLYPVCILCVMCDYGVLGVSGGFGGVYWGFCVYCVYLGVSGVLGVFGSFWCFGGISMRIFAWVYLDFEGF